jgi:hypothetical protein
MEEALIGLILREAEANNVEALEKYLTFVPLGQLDARTIAKFTDMVLSRCRTKECVGVVLRDLSHKVYMTDDVAEAIVDLYLDGDISLETLQRLALAYPEVTYVELVSNLIPRLGLGDKIALGLYRLHLVYRPKVEDLKVLIKESQDAHNVIAEDFLSYWLSTLPDYKEYAPRPSWMIGKEPLPRAEDVVIPQPQRLTVDLANLDAVIDIMFAGMNQLNISVEERDKSRAFLRFVLATMDDNKRKEILTPLVSDVNLLEDDVQLFRVLGPANPFIYNDSLRSVYGGSRMFIADEFDYDEDGDYVDWFQGKCDYCNKLILSRFRAVRMPRPHGGWIGCYCSFTCLNDALTTKEQEEGQIDVLTRAMVVQLETRIQEVGIIDRIGDFSKAQREQLKLTAETEEFRLNDARDRLYNELAEGVERMQIDKT